MLTNTHEWTDTLGQVLRAIEAEPRLDIDEESTLCRRAAAGEPAAAQRLVAANLRSVAHVARGFRNLGLPMEDLIHEGALGLLQAVPKFDPARGVRFFTYATFHVRRQLVAAVARGSKTVRVPRHVASKVRRFREERRRLSAGRGEHVGVDAVARSLGLLPDEAEATASFQSPFELSLDEVVGPEEGSATRGELLLRTEAEQAPDALYEAGEALRELQAALEQLDARDRSVLEARFGLDGEEPRTLRDLSARMSLSKERIRQLEERARTNLRLQLEVRFGQRQPSAAALPA